MMWGYPNSWWGWLLMTLGMLGFWGLLIALVVALVRRPGAADGQQHPGPEELLAKRFARGELDADQYRQHLQVLREQGERR
jgi:putative membrane protein